MVKMVELIERQDELIDEFGTVQSQDIITRVIGKQLNFTSREHLEATAIGLKPELKVEIPKRVYKNQTLVRFGKIMYTISRTYEKNDKIELTCYKNIIGSEDE